MALFQPFSYLAQAYGCGVYGQSSYNQCATDTPTQGGGQNPQANAGTGEGNTAQGGQTGQSSPTDQSQLQQTATPEQSNDFLGPSETTGQPSGPTEETGPMAGVGFDLILFFAFVLALLIALLIFLFRRLRRRNDKDSFHDNTTFPPSQQ